MSRAHRWRGVVVIAGLLASGCLFGGSRPAPPLRGYRVLIETHDSLSDYLARALSRKGFTVRRRVRGGSPPTAALVTFIFHELDEPPTLWLNARLADTRSGAIVAAVSAPIDSLGRGAATRAQSLADSFAAHLQRHDLAP